MTERLFGNGNGKEWEKPSGNPMRMGIGYKIGNGNGKEWKLTAWEWECKKPFPVISTTKHSTRLNFTAMMIEANHFQNHN